jgi:hypothetical protein
VSTAYLVAVTRWSEQRDAEHELPVLARAMALPPYDARVRLAGPLPLILNRRLDAGAAQALLGWLRQHRHGAVACDATRMPDDGRSPTARSFELRPDTLIVTDTQARTLALPHDQIFGLIRAAEITDELATVETTKKQLALGRAALTGGLLRSKQVTTVETRSSIERQEALYLFRSSDAELIVFRERELSYQGLGAERGHTHRQNFGTLVDRLRRCAPRAIYDERLLREKRRPELASVDGTANKRTVTSTNSAANQVAAYLLMHAHLQQQL